MVRCIGALGYSGLSPVDTTLVEDFFFHGLSGGGKAPLSASRGTKNPARNGDNCKIEPSISGIESSEQFSARAIDTPRCKICVSEVNSSD